MKYLFRLTLVFFLFVGLKDLYAIHEWTGTAGDSLWNNASNWNPNVVPDQYSDVTITTTDASTKIHILMPDTVIEIKSLAVNDNSSNPIQTGVVLAGFEKLIINGLIRMSEQNHILEGNEVVLNGDTMSTHDLDITAENMWDVQRLVISSNSNYMLSDDFIQNSIPLILDGHLNLNNKKIGLNSISANNNGMPPRLTNPYKIYLMGNDSVFTGIDELDDSSTDFTSTKITITPIDSSEEYGQVFFDLSGYQYDEITLERGARIGGAGSLDTLTLRAGKTYFIKDSLTVNHHLDQIFDPTKQKCTQYTLLMGSTPGIPSKLISASQSHVLGIEYAIVRNIRALADYGMDWDLDESAPAASVSGFNVTSKLDSSEYVWSFTGSKGDWHDPSSWTTSGGSTGCLPSPLNNVKFKKVNSADSVVIKEGEIAYCNDFVWEKDSFDNDYFESHGVLVVYGNFELPRKLSVENKETDTLAGSSNPDSNDHEENPKLVFIAPGSVDIDAKGVALPFDVEFSGLQPSSKFIIKSKLDVKELNLSAGHLRAYNRRVHAEELIVMATPASKILDIDSSVIVISGDGDIYNGYLFEDASFDIADTNADVHCDNTRIVLKGDEAIFNGGGNQYSMVEFKRDGYLYSLGDADTFGVLSLRSNHKYHLSPDTSIGILNSIVVTDTLLNGGYTSLVSFGLTRINDGNSLSSGATTDFSVIVNGSGNSICLFNETLEDVHITSFNGGPPNYCDSTKWDPSICLTNFSSSGWQHKDSSCFSVLSGFATDTRDSSRVYPGMASCFKIIPGNNQVMFDTIEINYLDTNGSFLFSNLETGLYIIKVDPLDTTLVPHYYPSNKLWSMADTINLISDTLGLEIMLSPVVEPDTANLCYIYGFLQPDTNAPTPLFNVSKAHLRGPVDIEDSLVIGLFSLDSNVFDIVQTVFCDTTGEFAFLNVPVGDYKIYPDIAGIPVDDVSSLSTVSVSLTDMVAEITFNVAEDSIYPAQVLYTSTYLEPELEIMLWPNPVKESLNVRAPYPIESVVVYDLMARRMALPFTSYGNECRVSVSGLSKGIYVIYLNGDRLKERFVKLD